MVCRYCMHSDCLVSKFARPSCVYIIQLLLDIHATANLKLFKSNYNHCTHSILPTLESKLPCGKRNRCGSKSYVVRHQIWPRSCIFRWRRLGRYWRSQLLDIVLHTSWSICSFMLGNGQLPSLEILETKARKYWCATEDIIDMRSLESMTWQW